MKTVQEMIEVMQAFADGKEIEFSMLDGDSSDGNWLPIKTPVWDWPMNDYRVKVGTPDSIDWSHVSEKYTHMARDEGSYAYLYMGEPVKKHGYWSSQYRRVLADAFVSYRRGTADWGDSLVARPSGGQ